MRCSGTTEAKDFLAPKPVSLIFGVGKVAQERFARDGFRTIADLQRLGEVDLMRRYGGEGQRLCRLARGIDDREVMPDRETKSISAETTFNDDIAALRPLEQQSVAAHRTRVAAARKQRNSSGSTVTLKLKIGGLPAAHPRPFAREPTQLAEKIFAAGRELLAREIDGTRFRLIGIGVSALDGADVADPADLLDAVTTRSAAAERALDRVRERFGRDAAMKGLAFEDDDDDEEANVSGKEQDFFISSAVISPETTKSL